MNVNENRHMIFHQSLKSPTHMEFLAHETIIAQTNSDYANRVHLDITVASKNKKKDKKIQSLGLDMNRVYNPSICKDESLSGM
jgi:hypothetical protein